MPEVNLFLDSRLNRLGKKRVYRLDVIHAINAKLEGSDLDHDYFDAWFAASELAEAGDNLEDYLNMKEAIDKQDVANALLIIDSKLKEYFDTFENALRAEVQHA